MIRNIKFYGLLEEKFGSDHKVNGDTIAHVISGLQSQHKKLKKYLMKGKYWHVLVNNQIVGAKQLDDLLNDTDTDIRIVPAIGGAWDPLTILYVIVVVLAIATAIMFSQMPDTDNAGNSASFMFNGAINSVEQGGPVPLVYGRTRVGSTVISSGVDASERGSYTSGYGSSHGSAGGGGGGTSQKIN